MIKDLTDTIKEFKHYNITRDIFYICSGLFLLLILDYFIKPDPNSLPNIDYFGTWGKLFAFVIFSYFFSRICKEIGAFFSSITSFLFAKNKIKKISDFKKQIFSSINNEEIVLGENRDISPTIIEDFIAKNIGLSFYERQIQHAIFEEIFLGFSLFGAIMISPWFLIASLIILISNIFTDSRIKQIRIQIAGIYLQEQGKKNKD